MAALTALANAATLEHVKRRAQVAAYLALGTSSAASPAQQYLGLPRVHQQSTTVSMPASGPPDHSRERATAIVEAAGPVSLTPSTPGPVGSIVSKTTLTPGKNGITNAHDSWVKTVRYDGPAPRRRGLR